MKIIITGLAMLMFTGCLKDAERAAPGSNGSVRVGLLTSVEGCDVYRFMDGGNPHYFVKCKDAQAAVMEQHIESCGKNCTTTITDEIPTVVIKHQAR
jgi:hypothetical protein